MRLEDQNAYSTSRFPKELLYLNFLRELRLIRPAGRLMPPKEFSDALRGLASTLEVLHITCQESQLPFFESPSAPRVDALNFRRRDLWNVSTTWPSLRVLNLQSSSEEDPPFSKRHIAQLPRSLVELRLATVCETEHRDLLSALPPSLTIFEIACSDVRGEAGADELASLPKLITLKGYPVSEDGLGSLPHSITNTNVTLDYVDTPLPLLPPKLRHLNIEFIVCSSAETMVELFASLPRELETFICRCSPYDLASAHVKALPSTLTSLHWIAGIDWDEIETASENGSIWPPHLRTIRVELMDRHFWRLTLPKSITELEKIPFDLCETDLHDAVKTLPPSLLSFACDISMNYEFGDPPPLRFPKGLTKLSINMWHSHWIPFLPHQLKEFRSTHLQGETDELLRDMQNLPYTLQHIVIEWTSMRLTNRSSMPFSHLHDLRHLEIGSVARFDPHFIRFLSRELTYFSVDLISFDAEDAKHLPPKLRYANFQCPLGAHFIEFWPEGCLYESGTLAQAIAERELLLTSRAMAFPDPRVSARFRL